jgi:hypothetical protein
MTDYKQYFITLHELYMCRLQFEHTYVFNFKSARPAYVFELGYIGIWEGVTMDSLK